MTIYCVPLVAFIKWQFAYNIILIRSQSQMDSPQLETIAHQAIYETNHQLKKNAEAQLENILFQMPLASLSWLLETHSPTVILATAAKLAHNVSKIPNLPQYLEQVNQVFRSWFNPNDGKFIRSNGKELENYCVNTVGLFLGKSLKELFQIKGNQKRVIEWLKMPEQGDKYRLYLFLVFIENVSLIDGSIGFVSYKILLQSFQEEVIPEMFSSLYPYFINFSETIEIAGLSVMQGRLNLKENNEHQVECSQTKTFNQFSFNIFQLLSEIINFKYNVNFKEFDEDQTKGTISFPESIIKTIIKKDFLDALYSIINRLLQMPPAENYFNICLECLYKILSAKINFISQELLSKFIGINLKGIVELLDSFIDKNKGNDKTLTKVVDCSNMFLEIFGLCNITDLQKLDIRYQEYFERWINRVYALPLLIMTSGQPIHSENLLFLGAVEMMQKIGTDIANLKIHHNLAVVKEAYDKFIELFFKSCLMTTTNILGQVTFRSLEDFKKTATSFFENTVLISSSNYLLLFNSLKQLLLQLYAQIDSNQVNISNLILFVTSMTQHELFFQVNINNEYLFDQVNSSYKYEAEVNAVGELFYVIFEFIKTYAQSNDYFSAHINNALILFYEALLARMVRQVKVKGIDDEQAMDTEIVIKDKLYIVIKKFVQLPDGEFLLNGLMGMSKLIKRSEIGSIEFIFACLHKLIAEIKHKFKREFFKTTDIYREMLSLFNSLVGEKLSKEVMRWRVLLFKTLSLLCFDDVLDDYRSNVRSAVKLIKESGEEEMDRVLYDLMGICDGIEEAVIFQYFLQKFLSEVNYGEIMGKLYQKLGGKESFLKDILHLSFLLIQKKDGDCPISQIYDIIDSNLPFWNHILQRVGADEERVELFEELYLIQKTLIAGGHINLAIVDQKSPVELKKFVVLFISHLKFFFDHVENYPSLIKSYFQIVELYFDKLKHLLYNHEDNQLALRLTDFVYTMMTKLIGQFENIINESYNAVIFQSTLQVLDIFFKYINNSKTLIHKKMYSVHLPSLLATDQNKENFVLHIFMLGLHFGNRKETETIRTLTQIAVNACLCFEFSVAQMAERIGVKNERDKEEFTRVVTYIKEGKEKDWIFFQLQDWFKDESRFLQNTIQSSTIDGY